MWQNVLIRTHTDSTCGNRSFRVAGLLGTVNMTTKNVSILELVDNNTSRLSAYLCFNHQRPLLTIVWKQECSLTRNGGLLLSASTRFSINTQSTSSSWTTTSFLRTLMAYSSSVPLRSASSTWQQMKHTNIGLTYKSKYVISIFPIIHQLISLFESWITLPIYLQQFSYSGTHFYANT